jgi:hypothetical protein
MLDWLEIHEDLICCRVAYKVLPGLKFYFFEMARTTTHILRFRILSYARSCVRSRVLAETRRRLSVDDGPDSPTILVCGLIVHRRDRSSSQERMESELYEERYERSRSSSYTPGHYTCWRSNVSKEQFLTFVMLIFLVELLKHLWFLSCYLRFFQFSIPFRISRSPQLE